MELSKIKLRMRILCSTKKMLLLFSDNMLEYVILSPVIKPIVMRVRKTVFWSWQSIHCLCKLGQIT